MSIPAWARQYRDRPIALRERKSAALTLAILLIVCLAGLLTRSAPLTTTNGERRFAGTPANAREASSSDVLAPAVRRAVDGFLAGYLAYLYGHGQANQVKDATVSLTWSLAAHAPHVPAGLNGLKPRILKLLPAPAQNGLIGVTAIISDQEIVSYRIPLRLIHRGGRFLISGLDAE